MKSQNRLLVLSLLFVHLSALGMMSLPPRVLERIASQTNSPACFEGSLTQFLNAKIGSAEYIKPSLTSDQYVYNTIMFSLAQLANSQNGKDSKPSFGANNTNEDPKEWVLNLDFGMLDEKTRLLAKDFLSLCETIDLTERQISQRQSAGERDADNASRTVYYEGAREIQDLGIVENPLGALLLGGLVSGDRATAAADDVRRRTEADIAAMRRKQRLTVKEFDSTIRAYRQTKVFQSFNEEYLFDRIGVDGWKSFKDKERAYAFAGSSDENIRVDFGLAMAATRRIAKNRNVFVSWCEVSAYDWTAVMYAEPPSSSGPLFMPVESVSWFDVQSFILRYNKEFSAWWNQDGGLKTTDGHRVKIMIRLPTEEEWMLAFKAGGNGQLGRRKDIESWHKGNSDGEKHQIAEKEPNAWGFFDMAGNVAEWTATKQGTNYVVIGGSYYYDTVGPESRTLEPPDARYCNVGFRLAYEIIEEDSHVSAADLQAAAAAHAAFIVAITKADFGAIYKALPDSFKDAIAGVANAFAAKMDPTVWKTGQDTMRMLADTVVKQNELLAETIGENDSSVLESLTQDEIKAFLVKSGAKIGAISRAATLEKLVTGDLQGLLDTPALTMNGITDTVTDIQVSDYTASANEDGSVTMTNTNDPDDEDRMVKVEGVWIPEAIAEVFETKDVWRIGVAQMKPLTDEQKQQCMTVFGTLQDAAKSASKATNAEEFQQTLMQGLLPITTMGGSLGDGNADNED